MPVTHDKPEGQSSSRYMIVTLIAPGACIGGVCPMWFLPGTPVSSTRKLISSSSFHRLDMTLSVAEALNPNKPQSPM